MFRAIRIAAVAAVAWCYALTAFAVDLTNGQRNTLRAAIFATPPAAALLAAGDVPGLQAWCNTATATKRWLPTADMLTIEEAPSYTTYDSLVQGKRDSWVLFLKSPRDFGKAKIRSWVTDVWGNAIGGSNAEAVLNAGTVAATNAQVAIGGTSRTTGTVTALDATYEEDVSILDATKLIYRDNGTIWTQ